MLPRLWGWRVIHTKLFSGFSRLMRHTSGHLSSSFIILKVPVSVQFSAPAVVPTDHSIWKGHISGSVQTWYSCSEWTEHRSRHMHDPITQVRCSLGNVRTNSTQICSSHCFNGGTTHHIFILLLLYYIVVLQALLPLLDKNGYTSVCDKWKYCQDTLEPSSDTRCGLILRAVNCDEISRDTSGLISL